MMLIQQYCYYLHQILLETSKNVISNEVMFIDDFMTDMMVL